MTDDFPWVPVAVGLAFAIPILSGLAYLTYSSLSSSSKVKGSRMKSDGDVEDHIKQVLRKIDPLDSLYFDVSVARHSLEEGKESDALEWLNPDHALGELKKGLTSKLLTSIEFDGIGEEILKIKKAIGEGRAAEAHAIIVPLQNRLAEKAYLTFKELDPIPDGFLDHRYETARETKVAEWRAKGYPQGLIDKTLKWADEWARGIARRFIKDPVMQAHVAETLYPEALELSTKFIEAMAK